MAEFGRRDRPGIYFTDLSAGSNPADRIELEPSEYYTMPKKKAPPKKKPGPKAATVKIEGDWKEAIKHALKRGKPARPAEK